MKKSSTRSWNGFLYLSLCFSMSVSALAGAPSDSTKLDVTSVQKILVQKKATWTAKQSWVSNLSRADRKRLLGLDRPVTERLTFEGRSAKGDNEVVDWRNRNGHDWIGAAMNQGNCGSCVAFATIATLQAQVAISSGLPWLNPTLSPQALFACGGGGCDFGWFPDGAAQFLQSTGAVDEACLPYTSGSTGSDVACTAQCSDSASRSVKISAYWSLSGGNGGSSSVDDVKAALRNGPLVTTLNVYADFFLYSSGVYKHTTGDVEGGHAISIIGFDDSKRAWLIRNSWGPTWGDHGFAWVSWDDESGVAGQTWGFQMPATEVALSVVSPSDLEYVSGQKQVSVSTFGLSNASDIKVELSGADGSRQSLACAPVAKRDACSLMLDTTQMKQGHYEIVARSPSGNVASQVREFYVLNEVPKMSLNLAPISGVDLTAPLTGRPEFNITVQSTPVQMKHLEFRVYDSTGALVSAKDNDYVLDQIKLGWRTITVPNGSYKILVHGETPYLGKVYAVDSNSYDITVKN